MPAEQVRGGREPDLIVGIVGAIAAEFVIDKTRVFIGGLSAGASMAVILGQSYPEIFSAVAAHSGLPRGAACDVKSAFAVMRGNAAVHDRSLERNSSPMRTLVIHGDADGTVHETNGRAITKQAIAAIKKAKVNVSKRRPLSGSVTTKSGRFTEFVDDQGLVVVRELIVSGGTHAWFGGSNLGSFTQDCDLNASNELIRFFLDLPAYDSSRK
ncbi:hypothetical protein ASF43_05420 [Pseudorhodoferax sp. Leaf267]|nr:hypothetical protein ASF43_05420 [Pseudorhodoferax sp. Leaf267]